MRWKELAWHLYIQSSQVLLNFCLWVEGEIKELKRLAPCQPSTRKSKGW